MEPWSALAAIIFLPALAIFTMIVRTCSVAKAPAPGKLDQRRLLPFSGAEKNLADLVRIATVSRFNSESEDDGEFQLILPAIVAPYPLVEERLLRTIVGERALLFEWPGSDGAAAPVILLAHYDVVPPGDTDAWNLPPFSGSIEDGCLHGRGSQDVKVTITGIMVAIERLLMHNFVPKRTIFIGFGGDEETGGLHGASAIANHLVERGIRASFLLDEGGFVADGIIPFAKRPLALVALAEKGYIDIAIRADGPGGHASMPPRHTAAGMVSKVVALSETTLPPTRLTTTIRRFLNDVSPYVSWYHRLLFRNLFLTAALVRAVLARDPLTNALVRTTTAATMLSGSDHENILPDKARAILNVRLLPGSDVATTMARIENLAARSGAHAEFAHHGHVVEPAPESPVDHEGYRNIAAAIREVFPESAIVPFLLATGTDSRHYLGLTDAVYRFTPIIQTKKDLTGIHGVNERISVENIRRCCLFYETLIGNL